MKAILNDLESQLAAEYEAVLRDYLDGIGEAALKRAYDLGRRALADGLGVLDMARVHHEALLGLSPHRFTSGERMKRCEKVFVESVTPFEMTHRGFRESYAALQGSEARYRELFENANDIVFSTDLAGNFTSVNPAGERLSGYALGEVLAMNFSAVVAPECLEGARGASSEALRQGKHQIRTGDPREGRPSDPAGGQYPADLSAGSGGRSTRHRPRHHRAKTGGAGAAATERSPGG